MRVLRQDKSINESFESIRNETVKDRAVLKEFEIASLTYKAYMLLKIESLIKSETMFRAEVDKGMPQPFTWMEEGKFWVFRIFWNDENRVCLVCVLTAVCCTASKPGHWKCKREEEIIMETH